MGSLAEVLPSASLGFECIAKPSIDWTSPAPPIVRLPSQTSPGSEQVVIGRISSLTSSIEEFCGIPYGTVPARWEHSTLRRSLPKNPFDASRHGPKSPQPSGPNNSGIYQSYAEFPDVGESETDCLNLFITRPSPAALLRLGYDPAHTKLPVYFYIHGGGYGFGAGTDPMWDPARLVLQSIALKKPFIAAVINYRLNLFGFAASSSIISRQGESQLKGCNFGIHDQYIALEWVSQNISSFGGDPENITLGGQSAGSCSVHVHVLEARSNPNPPLFKRAIMQSGALTTHGIKPAASIEQCEKRWNELCDYFGFMDRSDSERFDLLQQMPADDLVKAAEALRFMVFSLANDNLTLTALSETQWKIDWEQGHILGALRNIVDINSIDVLIGDTESEGGPFIVNALPRLQSYDQVHAIFRTECQTESDTLTLLQSYNIIPDAPLSTIHQSLIAFMTDVTFGYSVHDTHRQLNAHSEPRHAGSSPVVDDTVAHPTTAQLYRCKFGNPFPGPFHALAHHCVDLIYIFDAFHDDLDQQDERDAREGADVGAGEEVKAVTPAPNVALRQEIQRAWIDFIVGDTNTIDADKVVVYGEDRQSKVQSLTTDPAWVRQTAAFDLIGKYRRETNGVMNKFFALGFS